jgi:isopenicillin N synthase-like dioxygenase
VLLQDDQPGLEVFRRGRWHRVEPRRGALVINIGDIVQVWSNDRYPAPVHRAVTSAEKAALQRTLLYNPSYETNYAPLPSTVDPAHPAALPHHQLGRVPARCVPLATTRTTARKSRSPITHCEEIGEAMAFIKE